MQNVNTNPRRNNTGDNESLREFNYRKFDQEETKLLAEAAIQLIDKFFECDGNYVSTVKQSPHWPNDPLKVFEKIETVFKSQVKDDVDQRFLDFVIANTVRPFKWYSYNGKTVNVSPAQIGWWTKQLNRAGIDSYFLKDPQDRKVKLPVDATQPSAVSTKNTPAYHALFE
jgi:hypothetical protein